MPHIIIEYSAELSPLVDIEAVIEAAHRGALQSDLFPEYDIKTRAIACQHHRTGQTRDSFLHASIHLLSGRGDAQKSMLSESVLAALEPLLQPVISVSVEIVDIHRESYRKRLL